jgi:hypothetical protein
LFLTSTKYFQSAAAWADGMLFPNLHKALFVACNFMTKSVSIFAILTLTFLASFGQTKKDSLYVFVGEKLEVKSWPQPRTIESFDTTIVDGDTTIMKNVSLSMDASAASIRYISS